MLLKPLDLDYEGYLRDDYIVCDFETTSRDKGNPSNPDNRIVLAVWRVGPQHESYNKNQDEGEFKGRLHADSERVRGLFYDFGNQFEQSRLAYDIEQASFLVAHNAKFELGWLARAGIELRDLICWCTQIAEYNLQSNRHFDGGLGLDATLTRYGFENKLSYVRALIHGGVCPSEIDKHGLLAYCIRDVDQTERLFLRQRRELHNLSSTGLALQFGRCLQAPMLADIEQRGVTLDPTKVRTNRVASSTKYSRASERLEASFGALNWGSPKQVGELLYDKLEFAEALDYRGNPIRTPAGKRSASEKVISLLRATNDRQHDFLRLYKDLAGLQKELQYLESMNSACEEDNGVLYASYNQTVTDTGRLSSSGGKWGIQFQNIPRHLKGLFRAREKTWQILDGDCPQLEFRVATDLGRDSTALEDILRRFDIHSLTASIIGCDRQQAKPHTFKPLYGGRSGPPRVRKYYNAFRERYKGIYNTQMSWVYHVLEHKFLDIPTGLRFYWPNCERVGDYITFTPSIFNYPIQSFATADISQLSLLLVWHSLRGLDSYICNTVHDSGVLETPPEELDKVKALMVECYTSRIYEVLEKLYAYRFTTPLGLGIKVGEYWGEAANEEKFENEQRFAWTA